MANKAPAEKLPLAVRKNVRDEWEAKKAGVESEVSTLFGTPWTFDINPNAIYPYAEENSFASNSLGACILSYVNGAIDHFKYYVRDHGDGGKQELNLVCSKHVITLSAGEGFSYNGVKIEDGILKLIFGPTYLGTNTHQIGEYLAKAVSEAPQPEGASTLSYAARHAVKKDYDPKIGELLKKAQDIFQNPKLKFDCNFEEIGKVLKGGKDVRDDWETNLGDFAYRYYEAFVDVLKREKFDSDEMLREGFEEGVPEMSVKLRVVEKITGSYNETILENGALVLQTTPEYWGTNIHYAGEKVVDLL